MRAMDEFARLFDDFDFRVETDEFVLYEIDRLIEDDRASFEDEEFRRVIDAGIHEHIEERLDVRAAMAMRLRSALPRFDSAAQKVARRTLRALEDIESPLHNASLVVRSYAGYIFRRLQEASDQSSQPEDEPRTAIERWQHGEILREQLSARLKEIGRPAVGPLADLLFDAPEDRESAEIAVDTLAAIASSSSARVLAHAILEPILPEDVEMKAYAKMRGLWPLPRHYILNTIAPHTHEDLSFRWFQLLVECNELAAVDMIIDEILVHGEDAAYQEDLRTIIELLRLSRDPEVEEKIVAALNAPETPAEAAKLLQEFAANFRPSPQPEDNPWSQARRLLRANEQYLAVVKLLDAGKREEAVRKLDVLLREVPDYPFAVMLKRNL